MLNEQQNFWKNEYALDYIEKNKNFNQPLGVEAWKKMLLKTQDINTILECGCNIGRNLGFLNKCKPDAAKSIIEISKPAFEFVSNQYVLANKFNGPITESNFVEGSFDLVFTIGVLIHIHPNDLLSNMKKMFCYSGKYILVGEYFNRTPVMIEYQGKLDRLFKSDFGKLFMENFDVKLVDNGFLWGHIYDSAGFDDITWWLFEKNR